MAQLGARLDGIEEAVGSNPIGSTNLSISPTGTFSNTSARFSLFGPLLLLLLVL